MKETEITVQVFDSLEEIDLKLKKLGFKVTDEYYLNDFYFSKYNSNDLKEMEYLKILNNSILVREVIGENVTTSIIYKKKDIDKNGDVIGEEKVRTNVESKENILKILSMASLNKWCELKNHTITYKKDKFKIDMQMVEGLGVFFECEENEEMKNLSASEKFNSLVGSVSSLGLNIGKDFSCKKVYMKFLKENAGLVLKKNNK